MKWKIEKVPVDENCFIWVSYKNDYGKKAAIIVEIKANKIVALHYHPDKYSVDVDTQK